MSAFSRPTIFRRFAVTSVIVAVTLISALGPVSDVDAESAPSNAADAAKISGQPPADPAASYGRASTLAEETNLRQVASALPVSESPGLFSGADGQAVVRVFNDRSLRAANDRVSSLQATTRMSQFTSATLNALSQQLRNASRRAGVSYHFFYDAESDRVVVSGNLQPSELPTAAVRTGQVSFTPGPGIERQGRYNDTTPYWGGGAIIRSDGARCSTSFTVKNSAGTRYMVTAGHCGPVGTRWRTPTGASVGTTVSRPSFPAYDMSLIRGSSYGSYLFMGNRTGYGSRVLGAGDPVVGTYYCVSGTTTYENCGKRVTSLTATLCTSVGCTSGLAAYSGGTLTRGGDSGGPLVLKTSSGVHVRGLHIGINGNTMLGERWRSVASLFRVTVVT